MSVFQKINMHLNSHNMKLFHDVDFIHYLMCICFLVSERYFGYMMTAIYL